ncbi:zinc finger protein 62-like [Culicoides brevitarsis]|uniref:zinc finger protein 62-like n=1 Tax=Culicoides brevitarsis TaxID=469753 RepID=UPI00307BC480
MEETADLCSDFIIFTNFADICRLCALKYEKIEGIINEEIAEKIRKLFGITINTYESHKICEICQASLIAFENFYDRVKEGQKFFEQEILSTQFPSDIVKLDNIQDDFPIFLENTPAEELLELSKDDLMNLCEDLHEEKNTEDTKISFDIDFDDSNVAPSKRTAYRNLKKDALINEFYVFICPSCDILIPTWTDYREHLMQDHAIQRPKLRCCDTSLECERWSLLGHYLFHKSPEMLQCKKCGKQFNSIRPLRKHYKETHNKISKSEEKKFECDLCGTFVSTRSSMIYHMKRRHLPSKAEDEQILCSFCAKSFKTKEQFNQHYRYYHEETTEKCPHCGIVKKLEHLRMHIKRVHRENRVKCEFCEKEFLNKIKLKGHQVQVHVEPKFECDICLKKFKTKAKMSDHRATHFNILRFKCDLCDHMNNDYGNMTKHRKSKHRDVPYLPRGTARKVFEIGRQ